MVTGSVGKVNSGAGLAFARLMNIAPATIENNRDAMSVSANAFLFMFSTN